MVADKCRLLGDDEGDEGVCFWIVLLQMFGGMLWAISYSCKPTPSPSVKFGREKRTRAP